MDLQVLKDNQQIEHGELRRLLELVGKQLRFDASNDEEIGRELTKLNYNQRKLFIGIYCLYLETSRLNSGLESELDGLNASLDRVDMPEDNKRLIIDTYEQLNKDQTNEFRSRLLDTLSSLQLDGKQRFIDQFRAIELTKDSVVKSSRKTNYNHICQTEYLMNVQTDHTKHLFTCSIQNIEDMSVKFKEIMKQVDRLFTVVKK